jgi:hypothetical protein
MLAIFCLIMMGGKRVGSAVFEGICHDCQWSPRRTKINTGVFYAEVNWVYEGPQAGTPVLPSVPKNGEWLKAYPRQCIFEGISYDGGWSPRRTKIGYSCRPSIHPAPPGDTLSLFSPPGLKGAGGFQWGEEEKDRPVQSRAGIFKGILHDHRWSPQRTKICDDYRPSVPVAPPRDTLSFNSPP